MTATRIPWATDVLNFWSGCPGPLASPGCRNCYARRQAQRLQRMHVPGYERGFELTLHPKAFEQPRHWDRPRTVFVCSMSDFFHQLVPYQWKAEAFEEMFCWDKHTYLVVTKRPEHIPDWLRDDPWPDHIWLGVTVETQDYAWRLDEALRVPARHRFVSFEPLLGPVGAATLFETHKPTLFPGFEWSIIGAESGSGRRPCDLQWVRDLVQAASAAGVPAFVKQLSVDGSFSKRPELWPEDLRVQQFPPGIPIPRSHG